MATYNGVPIPKPPTPSIPGSLPSTFNWDSFSTQSGQVYSRIQKTNTTLAKNLKGYKTSSAQIKKVVFSSPSRKFVSQAAKAIKKNKGLIKKGVEASQDLGKMVEKFPGKGTSGKVAGFASKIAPLLIALAAYGLVIWSQMLQNMRFEIQDKANNIFSNDLSKAYSLAGKAILKARKIEKDSKEAKLENQRVRDRIYGLEKQLVPIREKSNDALYETRQGRKILEGRIAEANKKNNDTLAETRSYNTKHSNAISKLQADFNKYLGGVGSGFQAKIEATVNTLQKGLADAQANARKANDSIGLQSKTIAALQDAIKLIKPPAPGDTKAIVNEVTAKVREFFNPQLNKIPAIESGIVELKSANSTLRTDLSSFKLAQSYIDAAQNDKSNAIAGGVSNLASAINQQNENIAAIDKKSSVPNLAPLEKQLNDKFNQFVADNNRALNIKDLQQSELSKDFDRQLKDFERLTNLTADQRFTQFQQQNNAALGVQDLKISGLSNEFDRKIGAAISDMNLTADQRFDKFTADNIRDLNIRDSGLKSADAELDRKIGALNLTNTQLKTDLGNLDTQIEKIEKVNTEGNKKLDQMFPLLQLIPALPRDTANAIKPSIPTVPQIGAEVGKQVCNSANSGCIKGALDKQTTDINNAANSNKNNLLDAFNTGSNAAANAQIAEVLERLGDKIPGGLSGKLVNGFKWLKIDRALNVLILAATIHNGLMLSNNIGQTLLGTVNNILNVVGLKDDDNKPYDVGEVISGTVSDIIRNTVGIENYTQLTIQWTRASRIYQSAANMISSITNMSDVIMNGLELVAGQGAKIGNALRNWRVVGERAYEVFNPQPNLKWGIFSKLQKAQESADFLLQASQVPIDIIQAGTDFNQSLADVAKAIKEDPAVPKGLKIEDAAQTKAKEGVVKEASIAAILNDIDLDPDE